MLFIILLSSLRIAFIHFCIHYTTSTNSFWSPYVSCVQILCIPPAPSRQPFTHRTHRARRMRRSKLSASSRRSTASSIT
jgi:hypothetical protein